MIKLYLLPGRTMTTEKTCLPKVNITFTDDSQDFQSSSFVGFSNYSYHRI